MGEGIKVYDKEQERIYPLPGTEHLALLLSILFIKIVLIISG